MPTEAEIQALIARDIPVVVEISADLWPLLFETFTHGTFIDSRSGAEHTIIAEEWPEPLRFVDFKDSRARLARVTIHTTYGKIHP